MDETIKNDIFYRPRLEVERNYDTSGTISSPDNTNQDKEDFFGSRNPLEIIQDDSKDTLERLLSIRKVTYLLPDSTPKIIDNIIEPLSILLELNIIELEELISKEESDGREEIIREEPINSVNENNNEESSSIEASDGEITDDEVDFESDLEAFDIEIRIEKTKTNAEMCREQYLRDISDIVDDFSMGLNAVMQGYIYPLNTTLNVLGIANPDYLNYEYEGESVTDIPLNMMHLNDRIVIQDMMVAEKASLFEKTHDETSMMNIIKTLDAAEMLRERYYNETYIDDIKDELDLYSNNLLEKSRSNANSAYRQAKTNMFKHLDGTVSILKDICQEKLESQQAKAILLKNGVDIFNRKDYEISGVVKS